MRVVNEAQRSDLCAICVFVCLTRSMGDVSLKSASIPNFDAAIVATCEEKDMIWGDSNVLDRADMLSKRGDQNSLWFPWPIVGMIATPAYGLPTTRGSYHRTKFGCIIVVIVHIHCI